ncbi:hypothetical protein LTR85_007573 [Meristemomyces frigidus]|nr:hypothetical protein LTR85_007573 [Meristemomyces frigidus]
MESTYKPPFEHFRPLANKPVYLVTPGHGGTYTFKPSGPLNPREPRHIGFSGCYDSVGVYFAIDHYRCFAANISAWVKTESNEVIIASTRIPVTTDIQQTHDKVAQGIVHRLDMESEKGGWAGQKTDIMRRSLVMTGRWMMKGSRTSMLQTAVVHAV